MMTLTFQRFPTGHPNCRQPDRLIVAGHKASRPEAHQMVIYKSLGLPPQPGGITKTIIADRR